MIVLMIAVLYKVSVNTKNTHKVVEINNDYTNKVPDFLIANIKLLWEVLQWPCLVFKHEGTFIFIEKPSRDLVLYYCSIIESVKLFFKHETFQE